MTEVVEYSNHGWHGLVEASWQEEFADLEAWMDPSRGKIYREKMNRLVVRLETPRGAVFVKVVRTLADGRHSGRDFVKRLKWFIRSSRAVQVMRMHLALLEAGFGCPEPLLAVRYRHQLQQPVDVFVCRELLLPSFGKRLVEAAGDERVRLLQATARELCRFHHAGFVHGDCIPGNILLGEDGGLHFLDNDRTVRLESGSLQRGRVRNLVQLCRHIEDWEKSEAPGRIFLDAYKEADLASGDDLPVVSRHLVRREIRQVMLQCAHDHGQRSWLEDVQEMSEGDKKAEQQGK